MGPSPHMASLSSFDPSDGRKKWLSESSPKAGERPSPHRPLGNSSQVTVRFMYLCVCMCVCICVCVYEVFVCIGQTDWTRISIRKLMIDISMSNTTKHTAPRESDERPIPPCREGISKPSYPLIHDMHP